MLVLTESMKMVSMAFFYQDVTLEFISELGIET